MDHIHEQGYSLKDSSDFSQPLRKKVTIEHGQRERTYGEKKSRGKSQDKAGN